VTNVFAGQYQSVFKGRGLTFEEVVEYRPGDDIRFIDWNVTARTGTPYIKKFIEERGLTVIFLLDKSLSCAFGTFRQLKSQLAAEVCSLLALAALGNNDKVGLIVFTDRVERFVPPRKSSKQVLRIVRDALYFKPKGKGTAISPALKFLNRVTTGKAVVFIISDFFAPNFKKDLAVVNKRHDAVAITVSDPRELALPDVGLIQLDDAESGKSLVADTSDSSVRYRYRQQARQRVEERKQLFQSAKVDNIDIRTDTPYVRTLIDFFKMRRRRIYRS